MPHEILIPILIFCARILDVSIGTVRIILIGKGYRGYSALLGFIEVFIWINAIGQIMQNLDNWYNYLTYAGGFAAGTYLGMVIESKMLIGKVVLRIITKKKATELLERLLLEDYSLTYLDAEGRLGPVNIIFLVVKRKELKHLIELINTYNPNAFYTIEDVRYVHIGYGPRQMESRMSKKRNMMKGFFVRK